MQVELHHESDTAVDHLRGTHHRLAFLVAERLGLGHLHRIREALVHLPEGFVGQHLAAIDVKNHVGQRVLHRLKRADGPPEGHPVLGVFDGHLGVFPGCADHLAAKQRSGPVQHLFNDGPTLVHLTHQGRPLDTDILEVHAALLVLGQGCQRRLGNAGAVGVHQEQGDSLVGI